MKQHHVCVVMASYNNAGTLSEVLQKVIALVGQWVIVVNDGSTDDTAEVLARFPTITIISNDKNQGKGFSLKRGFTKAAELGHQVAITIDSDGQHEPADMALIMDAIEQHPGAMIMGARNMDQDSVPGKSSFGNKFSNFWFKVETGITLPDTQTGFRAYPLGKVNAITTFTCRFEYEIESIVKLAWNGVPFVTVPVSVRYDMPDRISHFRPITDFAKISLLNTWLVIVAICYQWPKKLFFPKGFRATLKNELVRPNESNFTKAVSIGFGLFMGILPIWGFQLAVGVPLAFLFKMNRALFLIAANISLPPIIPLILFVSLWFGSWFVDHPMDLLDWQELSMDHVMLGAKQYIIGAVVLAVGTGLAGTFVSWVVFLQLRRSSLG